MVWSGGLGAAGAPLFGSPAPSGRIGRCRTAGLGCAYAAGGAARGPRVVSLRSRGLGGERASGA
jgi:hypothetical protein